ncbi:MAG: response regulator [Brevundimonas sp.]|jgi:two-component system response regulator FixJ|nr:response regulator [Brevundimonas sp.]
MTHPVFVIDDDDAMRDALVEMLRAEGIGARGWASGMDFLEQLPDSHSAFVLTDVRRSGLSGLDLAHRLLGLKGERWPIVVITDHADVNTAVALMKAGVVDVIEKPFDPQRLIEALGTAFRLIERHRNRATAAEAVRQGLARLSPRERQVFDALIEGRSSKEIAATISISPRTVEIFRSNVMRKMGAANLPALIRMSLHMDQA